MVVVVTLVVALIRGLILERGLLLEKLLMGASLGLNLFKLLSDGCVLVVELEIGLEVEVLLEGQLKLNVLLFKIY